MLDVLITKTNKHLYSEEKLKIEILNYILSLKNLNITLENDVAFRFLSDGYIETIYINNFKVENNCLIANDYYYLNIHSLINFNDFQFLLILIKNNLDN